jgi:nitrogen fixation-related uncharacterized protein
MTPIYLAIYGFTVIFGVTAIAAFVWAIRRGQMENFKSGARTIFDEDEPVGKPTDTFPGTR